MIVLQVIDFHNYRSTFIRVEPRYHNLVKRINGRFLQEPGNNQDINTLFQLLGGKLGFKVSPAFGAVISTPIGCAEFYTFYYD